MKHNNTALLHFTSLDGKESFAISRQTKARHYHHQHPVIPPYYDHYHHHYPSLPPYYDHYLLSHPYHHYHHHNHQHQLLPASSTTIAHTFRNRMFIIPDCQGCHGRQIKPMKQLITLMRKL